jgi:hypothetical protein
MTKRPNVEEQELNKIEDQFEKYTENVNQLTHDRMNMAPKLERDNQTKMSQNQIADAKQIYLKPFRAIGCADKFNEDYRKQYEFDKEYVYFIAENNEVIGEDIDIWTRPYSGMPAEEWKVPVNKPVWGPRYLAEQIKRCQYHRFSMNQRTITGEDGMGQYTGGFVVDNIVNRIDSRPASTRKSIFMGANNFG